MTTGLTDTADRLAALALQFLDARVQTLLIRALCAAAAAAGFVGMPRDNPM
jgi:hypothetical protein